MILHACRQGDSHSSKPVLVWLHGLLGSAADWLPVQALLADWPHLGIDLPGHGGSQAHHTSGFDSLSDSIDQTLRYHGIRRYWLIGYSLGGRVALFHACRHAGAELEGLLVEGGHYGLELPEQRQQRQRQDAGWAERFRAQPLAQTLQAWYQQPVFADMTGPQRARLIELRLSNRAAAVADMLLATSLSRQPYLLPELARLTMPFSTLCGERDGKFLQLMRQASLSCDVIPAAGHNAHRENPAAFASCVAQRLTHS